MGWFLYAANLMISAASTSSESTYGAVIADDMMDNSLHATQASW
jgi:hypothetical protein